MTLRRPAAHLRRAPSWRRSGDESLWESFNPEGEVSPTASAPRQAARPQSAIEGGRLDCWLEQLQRMQGGFLQEPVHHQVSAFSDRTTSSSALHKEPAGGSWRQPGTPSLSGASSSWGSTTLGGSLRGSQESLQSWFSPPPERRGSWERAHIVKTPSKEQTQLSYLAPVKVGWLPFQRKVKMADTCNQSQFSEHSAGKLKLKQPITPTIHNHQVAASRLQDGKSERSRTSLKDLGVKTGQAPDRDPPFTRQVPEKQSLLASRGGRLVGWQALRRGWSSKRDFPRGSQSDEASTGTGLGTGSGPNGTSLLLKTSGAEPFEHPRHQTTSDDPCRPRGFGSTETYNAPGTGGVQPVRATVPLCTANSSASSAVTTVIPQSKAGFSSITISSRKVIRSASLPGVDTLNRLSQSREPPPPPLPRQPMDTSSRPAAVQRKAIIVKVTEQKMTTSGPVASSRRAWTLPARDAVDDVVRRRKAIIIKVTEQRESYSPAKAVSGAGRPEQRHSYADGECRESGSWSPGNGPHGNATPSHHLGSSWRPNATVAPNKPAADAENSGGTRHRSTASLVVSPPASSPPEVPLRAAGPRSERPRRPLSCYGNLFGRPEASEENMARPVAGKRDAGLPGETDSEPMSSGRGPISPSAVGEEVGREAGQPVAGGPEPDGGERERSPQGNAERRASPGLTLIKAPDPHSGQSAEDVLALNAAAIIANIKLQRRLSAKKAATSDTGPSPRGKPDEGRCKEPQADRNPVRGQNQPHAAFVPLSLDPETPPQTFSLQEALQRSRPGFISRSQCRVRELERRKQERRELAGPGDPRSAAALRRRRASSDPPTSISDNLFKARDGGITGKAPQPRSKRSLPEVRRKQEEEKKRETCLSNRQRVDIFKKKLLDQILQRGGSRTSERR